MKLHDPPRLKGRYLDQVLSTGHLTSGPMCRILQEATAALLRVRLQQVVLASSATAGFQGVCDLLAARFEKTDKRAYNRRMLIDITCSTWPGMHQAYEHAGLARGGGSGDVVVLTDIGGRRFIDEDGHRYFCDGDGDNPNSSWCPFAPDQVFVHDACHSWLPRSDADFGIVSFYPTKLVPGAEGGAVICKREEDAEELAAWLYCGLTPGAAGRGVEPRVPGRKANMTDVTAALNLEALELAPAHIAATEQAWRFMAHWAKALGVPYRDQPRRPYLFQVDVSKASPSVMGLPRGVPEIRWALANHPYWKPAIPTAWNFRPAPLVTLPCHAAAPAREIMEAVAEMLGL